MSRFEKISLAFGVVALLADFASLITFATGLLQFNQVVTNPAIQPSAYSLFQLVSGLIIVYGWLILS